MKLPIDQIIHGHNCEVVRQFPTESIDCSITSPPYDNLRSYGGHGWDFFGIAWNLVRVLKPGGVLVWVVADRVDPNGSETGSSMRQALHFKELGLNLHDTMIWQKPSSSFPERSRYWQTWEYMFVFSKGRPKTINLIRDRKNVTAGNSLGPVYHRDDKGRSVATARKQPGKRAEFGVRFNVWRFITGGGQSAKDPEAFAHEALYPEELARDHILSWTNPGDVVLDPFSGSGTTAKQAKLLDRRFIGVEVHEPYVALSRKRIASVKPEARAA